MGHKHSVRDMGAHFTIDQYTRQIKNDSAEKTTIVQYDHNSERLTFEMPLYVDGHAMTLCDLIEIHFINIATDGKNQNPGTYEVNDIQAEGEKAIFTWMISQEATQLAGSLNFFIVFKCTESGVTVYRWGTEIFKNLPISAGMDNGEAVLTEYPDILAQWKYQLFSESETAIVNVRTAEANALAAIEDAGEAKKQSVLDSIPDEYEALSALADQNYRKKAGAIVLDAEGESIVVNDASEYPLQNLKVFGKSTQDGTPTPDAPAPIFSVVNPVVTVYGKNLLENTLESKTHLGCDIVVNNDGSVVINGTATSEGTIVFNNHLVLPIGTYELSGERVVAFLRDKDNKHKQTFFTGKTITIEDPTDYLLVGVYANNGQVFEKLKTYPMLRLADETDDSFELYKETQAVETVNALHGIPVSSGGNYTDENGQQWICDEVDLARGVYVQRINQLSLDGSENWGLYDFQSTYSGFSLHNALDEMHSRSPGMSNQFSNFKQSVDDGIWVGVGNTSLYAITKEWYGKGLEAWKTHLSVNPLYVIYPRITPIETPLSDAEINTFRALHSNKPNTTILNDAGAHMAVAYVADTKTYIDNKIKEMMEVE